MADASGATSWVNVGTPQQTASTPTSVTYRLGISDAEADKVPGTGIAEILEAQGIAAIPQKQYAPGQQPSRTFTGQFRVLFKSPLPKNVAVASSVKVTGTMHKSNQNYVNDASILYGQKRWLAAPKEAYESLPLTSNDASATFKPISTSPKVVAGAYSTYGGDVTGGVYEKKTKEALVREPDAGWRFHVSNSAVITCRVPSVLWIAVSSEMFSFRLFFISVSSSSKCPTTKKPLSVFATTAVTLPK